LADGTKTFKDFIKEKFDPICKQKNYNRQKKWYEKQKIAKYMIKFMNDERSSSDCSDVTSFEGNTNITCHDHVLCFCIRGT
jgi:hypothetical protein